jgi:hypothetical protein
LGIFTNASGRPVSKAKKLNKSLKEVTVTSAPQKAILLLFSKSKKSASNPSPGLFPQSMYLQSSFIV